MSKDFRRITSILLLFQMSLFMFTTVHSTDFSGKHKMQSKKRVLKGETRVTDYGTGYGTGIYRKVAKNPKKVKKSDLEMEISVESENIFDVFPSLSPESSSKPLDSPSQSPDVLPEPQDTDATINYPSSSNETIHDSPKNDASSNEVTSETKPMIPSSSEVTQTIHDSPKNDPSSNEVTSETKPNTPPSSNEVTSEAQNPSKNHPNPILDKLQSVCEANIFKADNFARVNFAYELLFSENFASVLNTLERKILEDLAMELFACPVDAHGNAVDLRISNRVLNKWTFISSVAAEPLDEVSGKCEKLTSRKNEDCVAIDGEVTVYLSKNDPDQRNNATSETLRVIEEGMANDSYVDADAGILKVAFISQKKDSVPALSNKEEVVSKDYSILATTLILFSVLGLVVITSFFLIKRRFTKRKLESNPNSSNDQTKEKQIYPIDTASTSTYDDPTATEHHQHTAQDSVKLLNSIATFETLNNSFEATFTGVDAQIGGDSISEEFVGYYDGSVNTVIL